LIFIIFFICALAESNRHPFDLPEAEAELVSGYNVEYSGISFSLFFLSEYSSLIFMSTFIVNFFCGGWGSFFLSISLIWKTMVIILYFLKISFFCYIFVYIRGIMPRYRYDQLMRIG
jgi:NADH-quinone oxidoreductase subunit H